MADKSHHLLNMPIRLETDFNLALRVRGLNLGLATRTHVTGFANMKRGERSQIWTKEIFGCKSTRHTRHQNAFCAQDSGIVNVSCDI